MTNKITILLITAIFLSSGCNLPGPKTKSNSSQTEGTSTTDTGTGAGTGVRGGTGGSSNSSSPNIPPTANEVYALAQSFAVGQATDVQLRAAFDAFVAAPADLNTLADQGTHNFALLVTQGADSTGVNPIIKTFFSGIAAGKAKSQLATILAKGIGAQPFVRIIDIDKGISNKMAELYLQTAGHREMINAFTTVYEAWTDDDADHAFLTFLGGMLAQVADEDDVKAVTHWFYDTTFTKDLSVAFKHGYESKASSDESEAMGAELFSYAQSIDGIGDDAAGVIYLIKKDFFSYESLKTQFGIADDGATDDELVQNIRHNSGLKLTKQMAEAILAAIKSKKPTRAAPTAAHGHQ